VSSGAAAATAEVWMRRRRVKPGERNMSDTPLKDVKTRHPRFCNRYAMPKWHYWIQLFRASVEIVWRTPAQ
jgi:hypothetical protein